MTGLATKAIHGDKGVSDARDITAPLHVTTTYAHPPNPEDLVFGIDEGQDSPPVYSRINQPNVVRAEKAISKVTDAHAIAYSSGLSAVHALLTYLNPDVIYFQNAYMGVKGIFRLFERNQSTKLVEFDGVKFPEPVDGKRPLVFVETPINPTGEVIDIREVQKFAERAKAQLAVDSTFAPPPLFDGFRWGVDYVVHSATKYFGGHSDCLSGLILTKSDEAKHQLLEDRLLLGTILPSMEAWLLLRSLKTFKLRVEQQVETANKIAKYLSDHIDELPKLKQVFHASLQPEPWVKEQYPLGGPATFAILLETENEARNFPSSLNYFHHCTSLGGAESMLEWRVVSDPTSHPLLIRISIGCEEYEDLLEDLTSNLK